MNVIVLLADGARADWLARAMHTDAVPELSRLRDEGSYRGITTVFPSVTGPAYVPMLMGRFPGAVGLPGLRWFDRARRACSWPDYSRSYLGYQMMYINRDLDPETPTIFELEPKSAGGFCFLTRGLTSDRRFMTLSMRSAVRGALTHFRGDSAAMLRVDRETSAHVVERAGETRYMFAALGAIDKMSHTHGHEHPSVVDALRIVNDTVGEVRRKLERRNQWKDTRLWVTSDHGHSPIARHEDLERTVAALDRRVMAHPWVYGKRPDTAVMVSGNAMAHIYVDLEKRNRPFIKGMSDGARDLADHLLELPSVEILIAPLSETSAEVHSLVGGHAIVSRHGACYSYERHTGDPLCIGDDLIDLSKDAAYDACARTLYPDAIVQIGEFAGSPRAGDFILSAAPGWDFRSRYEPIDHVSTHGSLRREHMLVPMLSSHPHKRVPKRTVDLMPSALSVLGGSIPKRMDGESFE